MKDIKFEKKGDRYTITAVLENGQKVERELPRQAVESIMKVLKLNEVGACEYLAVHQWASLDQVPVAPPPPPPKVQAPPPPPSPPQAPQPPIPLPEAPKRPLTASNTDNEDLLNEILGEVGDEEEDETTENEATGSSTATNINTDSKIHIKTTEANKETKAKQYEKWDYADLRAEIKSRELSPKSMKTDTLIIALREDDKKRKK